MTEPQVWKGWQIANTALYLDQLSPTQPVHLHLQYDNEVIRVATFLGVEAARETQAWFDFALTSVGLANTELAARLREVEQ